MAPLPVIARYDSISAASTHLDPLEDVISWISGLGSRAYTEDILSTVHGLAPLAAVRQAAHSIAAFAANAVGLLEQAYSGPPEVSFLPLYYAILNLSKISIVAAGRHEALNANRWHGARYNPLGKVSHELATEEVIIKPKGVLPLLYEVTTGTPSPTRDTKIAMRNVYPYLRNVGHEYHHAYREHAALQFINLTIAGDAAAGFRILARTGQLDRPEAGSLRYLKAITGLRATAAAGEFHSKAVKATDADAARAKLLPMVRRCLLYETILNSAEQPVGALTPLSNRQLLMPEEIPIWIAFFHLSNIVRYNPEFIDRLRDSKCWPILLAMRKHCVLRFLLLTWSFFHQTEFIIVAK